MATIDIGKIKPVFKGTYDNSTAYVLDDIVYYNGSSYVAKTSTTGNLPTDNTKWNVLASGAGGIYDSTLGIGSAGQVLKVNSSANALEFGSAGGIIQAKNTLYNSTTTVNYSNGRTSIFTLTLDSAPTSGNKLLIIGNLVYSKSGGDPGAAPRWEYSTDNASWSSRDRYDYFTSGHAGADANSNFSITGAYQDSYQTGADTLHASCCTIVNVSDVSAAQYYRVTLRQTDDTNDALRINRGYNIGSGSGYAGSSVSNLSIIELKTN
tara:strand:+ start:368 stop:1162 length:795 start_codon:yes stop_codon:yes gene_type:complete